MYNLLLKIHLSKGEAGAIVPARDGDDKRPAQPKPISESQLDELRAFLRGPNVDAAGYGNFLLSAVLLCGCLTWLFRRLHSKMDRVNDDVVYKKDGAVLVRAEAVAAEQVRSHRMHSPFD